MKRILSAVAIAAIILGCCIAEPDTSYSLEISAVSPTADCTGYFIKTEDGNVWRLDHREVAVGDTLIMGDAGTADQTDDVILDVVRN